MSHQEEYETCLVQGCSQQLPEERLLQVPQGMRVLNSGKKGEKEGGWESPFPHRVGGLPPRSLLHPPAFDGPRSATSGLGKISLPRSKGSSICAASPRCAFPSAAWLCMPAWEHQC